MRNILPILLLCAALLLCACGKRQTEPAGSGSAEETTAEAGTTTGKKPSKSAGAKGGKAAETASPEASVQPADGKSRGGGGAAPAVPTLKIETPEDVDEAGEQLLPILAVNPVGNWSDSASGTQMVVDGDFRVSIVQTRADGTTAVWVFTGTYDPASGVMTYSDGMKQEMTASGMKTAWKSGRGTLTVRDGALVWADENESKSITFQREEG